MSLSPNTRPKITLEDLLRLKKAERPPAEFWPEFEARLREKQLAALLPPERRGWAGSLGGWRWLARVSLPLAAVAAVAVGVLTWRQAPTPGVRVVGDAGTPALPEEAAASVAQEVAVAPVASPVIDDVPEVVSPAVVHEAVAVAESRSVPPAEVAKALPWLGDALAVRSAPAPVVRQLVASAGEWSDEEAEEPAASWMTSARTAVPAWLPSAQHLRAAVAADLRVSSGYAQGASSAWARRSTGLDNHSRSRFDADFRGEISRIGVTGSTLSFKF